MSEKTDEYGRQQANADRRVSLGGRLEWIDATLISLCVLSLVSPSLRGRFSSPSETTRSRSGRSGDHLRSGGTRESDDAVRTRLRRRPNTPHDGIADRLDTACPTGSRGGFRRNEPRSLGCDLPGGDAQRTRESVHSRSFLWCRARGLVDARHLRRAGCVHAAFRRARGAIAFFLVYAIAWNGGTSAGRLVLAGVIVSTVFGSLQTGLYFFIDDLGTVQEALAWTTGTLSGSDWSEIRLIVPWTLLTVVLSIVGARQLNVLLLGERTARSLGMSVERARFGLSAIAIVAASASVAVAGIVGFVGLIVPTSSGRSSAVTTGNSWLAVCSLAPRCSSSPTSSPDSRSVTHSSRSGF